jgi:hypothetical protein
VSYFFRSKSWSKKEGKLFAHEPNDVIRVYDPGVP